MPETTALCVYSLDASADRGDFERTYKVLKEIQTGNVEFTMETDI